MAKNSMREHFGRKTVFLVVTLLTAANFAHSDVTASSEGATAPSAGQGQAVLYIFPGEEHPGSHVRVELQVGQRYSLGESVVFVLKAKSTDVFENCRAHLVIKNATDSQVIEQGTTPIDLARGENLIEFHWSTADLAAGDYIGETRVTWIAGRELASRQFRVRVLFAAAVSQTLEQADALLAETKNHLDGLVSSGNHPPYALAQCALGQDVLKVARQAFDAGELAEADAASRYALDLANRARSELVFGGFASNRYESMPGAPSKPLSISNGDFLTEGKPVYLVGFADNLGNNIERVARYHLNAVILDRDVTNEKTEPSVPSSAGAWSVYRWSSDTSLISPSGLPDMPSVESPRGLDWSALTKVSCGVPVALCMLERPHFLFAGEEVRRDFIRFIRDRYVQIDEVNKIWRSRLFRFEEIALTHQVNMPKDVPNYVRHTPYQFDLQTYHQMLAARYLQNLRDWVKSQQIEIPLFVAFDDDVFEPGETVWGLDRELLEGILDVMGCVTKARNADSDLAINYPLPFVYYALLQSLSPKKPVLDIEMCIPVEPGCYEFPRFSNVYTTLWNGVVAGADGMFLRLASREEPFAPLVSERYVDCVEAASTASLDFNRLGEVISQLQSAGAEVAVLWSMPSKMAEGGKNYLETLLRAYEGASYFGLPVRFISERQCSAGDLLNIRILIIPDALNVSDEAYAAIKNFAENNGGVIRMGRTMTHDEHGIARRDVLESTPNTVLIRGEGLARHYLGALDALYHRMGFSPRPRTVNEYGYPIEGVVNRAVRLADGSYLLYVVNIRKEPVYACLEGGGVTGRDLIHNREITFPTRLESCEPLLIQFAADVYPEENAIADASPRPTEPPSVTVTRVVQQENDPSRGSKHPRSGR